LWFLGWGRVRRHRKNGLEVTDGTEKAGVQRGCHTLKKCLAFFDFRLGSRHARKFDAAGILPCAPIENTVLPALLRVTIQGVAAVLYVAFLLPLPYDCHSEWSRGEGCKDRKTKVVPRRSRSFAEKARHVSAVRSKTKGCGAPRRDMVGS